MSRFEFLKLLLGGPVIWFPILFRSTQEPQVHPQWDYNIHVLSYQPWESMYEALQRLGKDGWELVDVYGDSLILKRRRI